MSSGTFEIVVKGTLSPTFAAAFDGFRVHDQAGATTRLVGWVPDQARLHGALEMLRDLGVELMSVTRIDPQPEGHDRARDTKDES